MDGRNTVATLLATAGLNVPDDEIDRLTRLYPRLRRQIDALYDVDLGDEGP